MKCQIATIIIGLKTIKDSTSALVAGYKSEWTDEVHESFRPYISTCKECVSAIEEKVSLCKSISERLKTIDVERIIANAQQVVLQERNF